MSAAPLRDLELTVLLAVVELLPEAYAAAVGRLLAERTGRAYSVGAVHTTLSRLEGKGLLTSALSAPLPVRGGRARREFQLTTAGWAAARAGVAERERAMRLAPALGREADG